MDIVLLRCPTEHRMTVPMYWRHLSHRTILLGLRPQWREMATPEGARRVIVPCKDGLPECRNAVLAHVKHIFIWLPKATFDVPLAVCRRPECPLHYANCLSMTGYYFSQRGNVDRGEKSRAQTQFSSFWEAIINRWETIKIVHVGWLISRTGQAARAHAAKSSSGSKLTSLQQWFKNSNGNSAAKQNNETKSHRAQKRRWPHTMLFHWVSYFHSKPKFQNVSLINRGGLKG